MVMLAIPHRIRGVGQKAGFEEKGQRMLTSWLRICNFILLVISELKITV